jgi:hypothetical protein
MLLVIVACRSSGLDGLRALGAPCAAGGHFVTYISLRLALH